MGEHPRKYSCTRTADLLAAVLTTLPNIAGVADGLAWMHDRVRTQNDRWRAAAELRGCMNTIKSDVVETAPARTAARRPQAVRCFLPGPAREEVSNPIQYRVPNSLAVGSVLCILRDCQHLYACCIGKRVHACCIPYTTGKHGRVERFFRAAGAKVRR